MVTDTCPSCGKPVAPGEDCPACGPTTDEDPELEAWLLMRETDLEEQAFALADQFGEEWRR